MEKNKDEEKTLKQKGNKDEKLKMFLKDVKNKKDITYK